jgi:hydrogenase maturation protein HypF
MKKERAKIIVNGAVQGVGFRPFVYRMATELCLDGWVLNSARGVFLEVEGPSETVRQFVLALETSKPPRAIIQSMEFTFLDAVGYAGFEIRESDDHGKKSAFILPDIATCQDCLSEIFDPSNRRYRYPFTNCTNCGPRFTIIESLPYDRPATSMKSFTMCPECEREYHDPRDRRFHAQPNACPRCGPQLELWDGSGTVLGGGDDALRGAAEKIRAGKIVALKGIGGFQLIADARNDSAVAELRARKRREEKPFALMVASVEFVRRDCHVSALESRLLRSPESPIVLLRRRSGDLPLSPSVAPGNPMLGVMLPCAPLHHLLMRELCFPVIATSGNLSDEPICIEEHEALERLNGMAGYFLVHNRPIVRHVDDSVVRVVRNREMMMRRARGYAPLPVHLKTPAPSVLAVGAHLKNTVALGVGKEVFISQHIGDLETVQAWAAFRKVAADLPRLYGADPEVIACDMHPEYLSTKYAAQLEAPVHPVQHHWAHVLSCMADNDLEAPVLGVAWDGTGYGPDGTVWGGEFLLAAGESFERVAHLRQFRLPGGEVSIRQPRRSALGILYEIWGEEVFRRDDLACVREFSATDLALIQRMLANGLQSPVTSSAGRLFDAVASILGLRHQASYEGQAAMALEFAAVDCMAEGYPFELIGGRPLIVDWQPMIEKIVEEVREGEPVEMISAKFHNTLAEMIVAVAREAGEQKVVLTGGCFQNRCLVEKGVERLSRGGFQPYWHQRVPPNDGGIALGQVIAVCNARGSKTAAPEMAEAIV